MIPGDEKGKRNRIPDIMKVNNPVIQRLNSLIALQVLAQYASEKIFVHVIMDTETRVEGITMARAAGFKN